MFCYIKFQNEDGKSFLYNVNTLSVTVSRSTQNSPLLLKKPIPQGWQKSIPEGGVSAGDVPKARNIINTGVRHGAQCE